VVKLEVVNEQVSQFEPQLMHYAFMRTVPVGHESMQVPEYKL
jgi:hypothetical protein